MRNYAIGSAAQTILSATWRIFSSGQAFKPPGPPGLENLRERPQQSLRYDVVSRRGLWVFGWLLLSLTVCTAAAPNRFSAGNIQSSEFFPILPWDPLHGWDHKRKIDLPHHGLDSIAECGFNMAGFILPQDLRDCEKLGLGAILLTPDPAFTNFHYYTEWRTLTDEQIDKRVQTMVRGAGRSKAVSGFFITDEPGVRDFAALGKAVAAVKKYAPGKLAYINLYPDYATIGAPDRSQLGTSDYSEYLERFVAEVKPQAISYDNYMVQISDDFRKPDKTADYFRNLLEIRRVAQKHGLPYLNIVCCNQIRHGTPPPSPANLLLQAYTTLAAGYRGITWYNYFGPGYQYTAINPQSQPSVTWSYLQMVNRQSETLAPILQHLDSSGVFFSGEAAGSNLPRLPGQIVASVTTTNQTPVMIGEFGQPRAPRGRWVMLVNLSLEHSARITCELRDSTSSLRAVSPVTGSLSPADPKDGFFIAPGQGLLLQATPAAAR
jgi:hypothetical protein